MPSSPHSSSRPKGARRLEERLSRRFQVHLVGEGALVGLLAGGVITGYRLALSHAEALLRQVTQALSGSIGGILLWFGILALVCLVVGRLMLWEPYTQGSGIPQIDAEVAGRIDMPWHRVIAIKFVEGTLCAFSGLSLGREGPSVQLGGMSGKAVSKALGRGRGEERLLVTCGAAAGMSAAFHAPLTGVLFAIEEIHKEFTAPLIISVMASSVVADFTMSQVLGVSPVVRLDFLHEIPHRDYLFVLVLGVVAGLVGVLHNRGMFACQEKAFSRVTRWLPYARIAVPFALAGVVAFTFPQLMCGGDAIVELIRDPMSLVLLPTLGLLLAKYLFTTVCFGSGAPGGTLFPLVVMGALVGACYSMAITRVFGVPDELITSFVALGIAGLFASVIRAPVTAVVLVFELTGSLNALLAASIVSIVSYVTANVTETDPFYEHLYANLIGVTADDPSINGIPGEKVLHRYTVGVGSVCDGRLISDVAWPKGCLVVTVDRAGQEIVAKGATRMQALDEILVIMDSQTDDEKNLELRRLCRPRIASGTIADSTERSSQSVHERSGR